MRNAKGRVIVPRPVRTYTATEMAALLRITRSYFSTLAKNGVLHCAKNADGSLIPGRYDLAETVGTYCEWLAAQKKIRPPSAAAFEEARCRKMTAHALHAELETAHLAGRLLARNDVKTEVQNMILALRSKLIAFPSRAAHSVLGKEDLKEIISSLTSEMEDCFADLREIDLGGIVERNKKQGRYVGAQPAEGDFEGGA